MNKKKLFAFFPSISVSLHDRNEIKNKNANDKNDSLLNEEKRK